MRVQSGCSSQMPRGLLPFRRRTGCGDSQYRLDARAQRHVRLAHGIQQEAAALVNIVENCRAIDLKVCEGDRGEIIMEDWTLDSSRVKREVRDWLKDAMSGPLMKTVLEVGQELWGCELKRLILSVGYKSTKHRQLLLNSTNLALLPTAQCGCLNSLNLRVHAIMRIGLTLYMCTRVQT